MGIIYLLYVCANTPVQRNNARVIADSILNLHGKGLITAPSDDPTIAEQLGAEGYRVQQDQASLDDVTLAQAPPTNDTN